MDCSGIACFWGGPKRNVWCMSRVPIGEIRSRAWIAIQRKNMGIVKKIKRLKIRKVIKKVRKRVRKRKNKESKQNNDLQNVLPTHYYSYNFTHRLD